jgi:hypothetical protein
MLPHHFFLPAFLLKGLSVPGLKTNTSFQTSWYNTQDGAKHPIPGRNKKKPEVWQQE